ncbi:G-type lectin S-receptor-like serine/threonine-protein kinase [Trichinella spiralis]|uniref:G-type lectin S-receptor-like serine/threonine-protein kinase n=1 Tax=Trichinella spiralis TaxID=6334 RepID=A0ABR3KFI5_TRISP
MLCVVRKQNSVQQKCNDEKNEAINFHLNSLIPPHAFEMENFNNIGNCGCCNAIFTVFSTFSKIQSQQPPTSAVASGMRRLIGASLLRECPE